MLVDNIGRQTRRILIHKNYNLAKKNDIRIAKITLTLFFLKKSLTYQLHSVAFAQSLGKENMLKKCRKC